MSNEENLIPVRTAEEARRKGRNGGIASGEARRRKRDNRKIMIDILSASPVLDKQTLVNLHKLGIYGKGKNKDKYDLEMIINAAIAQKAMRGDVKAYRAILETIGEDIRSKLAREGHGFDSSANDGGLTIVYDYGVPGDADAEDDDDD